MRKAAKKTHPLVKFARGSITFSLIILVVIIGSVLLVGGFSSIKFPSADDTSLNQVVPDPSSLDRSNKTALQLKTLGFKKVTPAPLPKECLGSAAVTLQLDISGSMERALPDLKKAVFTFTQNLSDESVIGIQAFNELNARNEIVPVSLYKDAKGQIDSAVGNLQANGGTPTFDALNFSKDVLQGAINSYPDKKFSYIFFSDGIPTVGPSDNASISQAATGIKNLGVTAYAIGLGFINTEILNAIASSPDKVLYTTDSKDLEGIYSQIKTQLCQ